MDPLQVLPTALSLPADSPEQIELLSRLKDHLEQQPTPLPVLIPPLLSGVLASKDSAFKRWLTDLLQFGLSRSSLPYETKALLAVQTLDSLYAFINDPSPHICKSGIQCLASAYPHLFRHFCVNRTNRTPWDGLTQAKRRIFAFIDAPHNAPTGLVVAAIKFMQRVVIVQSRGVSDPRVAKIYSIADGPSIIDCIYTPFFRANDIQLQNKSDVNLNMCPPDHPFINARELEAEGVNLLQQILGILFSSQNPEVLSATLNCLVSFIKLRPVMIQPIVASLTAWTPINLADLPSSEVKSVEKAARIVLVHIVRHGYGQQYQQEINEALTTQQARMDTAARDELARKAESSRKRVLSEPFEEIQPKRARTDAEPVSPATTTNGLSVLAAFDFTTLPHALVTDLVIANLVAVSQTKLEAAVAAHRQTNPPLQSVPASAPPAEYQDAPATSKAAASDEPLDPLKMELDEDELDFEPDKFNSNLEGEGRPDEPDNEDNNMLLALQQVEFELPPARPLGHEEKDVMIRQALDRIRIQGEETTGTMTALPDLDDVVDIPKPILGLPPPDAWILFMVRLATRGPAADHSATSEVPHEHEGSWLTDANGIRRLLCEYIMEDFSSRARVATIWMNEEWYNDMVRREVDSTWQPQYDIWVQTLLQAQRAKLDAKDKSFTRFLMDLPALPPNLLSLLRDLCTDVDVMAVGFTGLRELVQARPTVRQEAMQILLDLTTHPDKVIRGAAIITVRRWVPETQPMDRIVRRYARGMLNRLTGKTKSTVASTNGHASPVDTGSEKPPRTEGSKAEVESEEDDMAISSYIPDELSLPAEKSVVLQHVELLLGLAVKVHDFLDQIFETYCQMDASTQDVLGSLLVPLVRTLGPNNAKLLDLLRTFRPEAESLALKILTILTENSRPTPAIVSLVKGLLGERELDPRFLTLIIAELDKTDVVKFLPRVVSTLNGKPEEREQVRKVFSNIVVDAPVGVSTNMPREKQNERLAPAELMVLLHDQEKEIGLKSAMEAIGICFAMSDVFRSETLAVVMQQIVDEPNLPVLFMRTVIQAVATYKNLISFVTTTLFSRLIVKKIWTNPPLWEGFIRCAKVTAPASFGALLQLQKEQLREVVDKQPSLRSGLREYVIKKERSKPKLASFLETLGDGGEGSGSLQDTPAATPPPAPMPTAVSPNA